jgi:hypothetical protein
MSLTLIFIVTAAFNPVLSTGPDALSVNPAQLACPERSGFACRILDLDAVLSNNSFSFGQYNRYTGAYLDSAAKADILHSIPTHGVSLAGQARASAAEFGYGSIAASVRTVGTAEVGLPKDVFDLALNGNALDRTYLAENVRARAQVYWRAGVACATGLGRHVSVGVGAHRLQGLYYREVTDASACFVTTPSALASAGKLAYREATGGSGWAFDTGVAYWVSRWRFSLACLDANTGIAWTDGVKEGIYSFALDSSTAYEIGTSNRFSHEHQEVPGGMFVTRLPVTVNIGCARRISDRLNLGMLVQPKFGGSDGTGAWSGTAFCEAWPLTWLPLGCQVGYRSLTGPVVGLAAAVLLRKFAVTFGATDIAGLFSSAKGAELRFGVGYATCYVEPQPAPDVLYMHSDE